jgi:hypothetical protein
VKTLRASALLVLAAWLSGCMSTHLGYLYLPERTYYRMYEQFMPVSARPVRHVKEAVWGTHMMGFELKAPDVRAVFNNALGGNPRYYAADINIYTDVSGTTMFTFFLLGLTRPRVVVEFDVVEVQPWSEHAPGTGTPADAPS